jgi:hypothetical protein
MFVYLRGVSSSDTVDLASMRTVCQDISLKQGCGSGFNDFVDPDPYWESGSRIQIQGQDNEEK